MNIRHIATITLVWSTTSPMNGINMAAPITPVLMIPVAALVWGPSSWSPRLKISGHITEWNRPATSMHQMPTMLLTITSDNAIHSAPAQRQIVRSLRGWNFVSMPAPMKRPTICLPNRTQDIVWQERPAGLNPSRDTTSGNGKATLTVLQSQRPYT